MNNSNFIFNELSLICIESGDDFWSIIDELTDDKSNFLYSKSTIVSAYKNKKLYGLSAISNDMISDKIFCTRSPNLLPCFCIVENSMVEMIWVHSRARRNKLGTYMMKQLSVDTIYEPLESSMCFWEYLGIKKIENAGMM